MRMWKEEWQNEKGEGEENDMADGKANCGIGLQGINFILETFFSQSVFSVWLALVYPYGGTKAMYFEILLTLMHIP